MTKSLKNVNIICKICGHPICFLQDHGKWYAYDGNLGSMIFGGNFSKHHCIKHLQFSAKEVQELLAEYKLSIKTFTKESLIGENKMVKYYAFTISLLILTGGLCVVCI
jgi:hypothetical protein